MSEKRQSPQMKRGPMGGHGPGAAAMPGEKAHNFKGTIKKLLKYLGKYKVAIILILLFAVLGAAFNIVGPKILGQATTEIFNGIVAQIKGTGGIDFGYVGFIVILMAILYGLSSGFSFIQGWVMTNVSMKITYRFRKDISEKINRMPLKYFESTSQGEVLSR
ncbi:MAG: ABC transporter transmembrane domain-containing protein, partial [Oscillospiraceae bacterium]